MTRKTGWLFGGIVLFAGVWAGFLFWRSEKISMNQASEISASETSPEGSLLTEDDWRKKLTQEEYHILRDKGTDVPFQSPYWDEHRAGTYYAVDTGEALFRSENKFDSGTGWPSFTRPISPDVIETAPDSTLLMERTEILSKAGGHLGHVFHDGPPPTGLRYCMNGTALRFVPDESPQ